MTNLHRPELLALRLKFDHALSEHNLLPLNVRPGAEHALGSADPDLDGRELAGRGPVSLEDASAAIEDELRGETNAVCETAVGHVQSARGRSEYRAG